MDFLSQYENLQVVTEGETRTFRARRASDQRPVLLHQLNSNPQSGRQVHLLAMLLRHSSSLRPGSQSPILGIEEQGGSVWVITEDRPEMASLLDWMERQAPAKSGSNPLAKPSEIEPGGSPARAEPSAAQPGSLEEKTVLFATRLASADSLPVVDVDATLFTGVGHRRDAAASETSNAASEATRAFPAIKLPSAPPDDPAPRDQGSTLMLHTPAPPAGKAEDRTRAISLPQAPAGDATVFMQPPAASQEKPPSPLHEPVAETPVSESETSGEFTMLFRKPPAALAGEQKPRFMGFTAPTPEKARFIESSGEGAPLPDLNPIAPPGHGDVLKPSGSFTFQPPAANEADKTQAFVLPSFPSGNTEETWPPSQPAQPGEFTQVFQRPPASSRPEAEERQEPGAFTRIFQIPVGSDLLSAPESQAIFSAPAAPPAIQPGPASLGDSAYADNAAHAVDAANAISPAAPPAAPAGGSPKLPAMPAFKAPAMPSVKPPAIPAIPSGGGAKPPAPALAIPKVSVPKAPAIAAPKMPAMPKASKLEKPAAGAGPSILPLLLVFGGIVLVAVLVVLFFATKH